MRRYWVFVQETSTSLWLELLPITSCPSTSAPSAFCGALSARVDFLLMTAPTASLPQKVVLVALKRLEDAESAGDKILAVIAGVGVLQPWQGHLDAAHPQGQAKAVRRALEQADA